MRKGGGEFAFGCVTSAIHGAGDSDAVEFDWNGQDEINEASGDGWAELQPEGSLKGQICFHAIGYRRTELTGGENMRADRSSLGN